MPRFYFFLLCQPANSAFFGVEVLVLIVLACHQSAPSDTALHTIRLVNDDYDYDYDCDDGYDYDYDCDCDCDYDYDYG